jgi:Predicted membrane protein
MVNTEATMHATMSALTALSFFNHAAPFDATSRAADACASTRGCGGENGGGGGGGGGGS